MMSLSPYRRFRQVMSSLQALTRVFSGIWLKVMLVLSLPLVAIRFITKGRDEAEEEKTSGDTFTDESFSDETFSDETFSDETFSDESFSDEVQRHTEAAGPGEDGLGEAGPREVSPDEDGPKEDGLGEDAPKEGGLGKDGPDEVIPDEDGPGEDGPKEVDSPREDGPDEVIPDEDGPGEDGPKEVDSPREDGPDEAGPKEVDSPKEEDGPKEYGFGEAGPDEDGPDETSPEPYRCEYDSTWDSDEAGGARGVQSARRDNRSKKSFWKQSYKFDRFQAAAEDLQNYRHDYPIKPFKRWNFQGRETTDKYPNLDFYLGKRPSSPDNVYISDFHTSWRGKYDDLESVHSYIQWLFPLQVPGVNPEASTLTKEEIQEFCRNDLAKEHLLESYKLMLDFYGIELADETTGEVKRAGNWLDRFTNLNRHTHNNLRITRILKCLGTLGFAHYQAPLVHFFLEETLLNGELPRVKDSVLNYFLFTVLDKRQRRSLLKFAFFNFDEREEFVWCPLKIQRKWAKQMVRA